MVPWRGLSLLLLLLLPGLAPAQAPLLPGQWGVREEGPATVAFTQLEGGERFGLLCAPGQDECAPFLAPGWACAVGQPTLVRLEGAAGILRLGGQCAETALGPVVVFEVDLAAFVRGSPAIEVSLLSPARERVTLRFGNEGAAAAMEAARVAQAERSAAN